MKGTLAKHGKAADGLCLCGLVLQHIPVFGQEAVFEPDNVGGDPCGGPPHPSKAVVRDDVIAFCDEELVLVAQGIWRRADKREQSFTSWRNVRAVLNVLRRSEAFCCRVIAFVEESVEGFENDRPVLFGCCLWHVQLRVNCDS
jgi:hypothetical protein